MKFPVICHLSGNLTGETGSQQTASSAPLDRALPNHIPHRSDRDPISFGAQPSDYGGSRGRFSDMSPGVVAVAGSGGAGKAIGFTLAGLGVGSIRLFDLDQRKSHALAEALQCHQGGMTVHVTHTIQQACQDADGLINCTPAGMVGYGGNAFEDIPLAGRKWVCDAVYTPLETTFLKESKAAGVAILSGYELFLYQGIHAFKLFTGLQVDAAALRFMIHEKRT